MEACAFNKGSHPPCAYLEVKQGAMAAHTAAKDGNQNPLPLPRSIVSSHSTPEGPGPDVILRKARTGRKISDQPFLLRLAQWNAHSVQSEAKLNFIRSLPFDILALQEIWNRVENLKNGDEILSFMQRNNKRGGGTALTHRLASSLSVSRRVTLNKDSEAIKLRLGNSYF